MRKIPIDLPSLDRDDLGIRYDDDFILFYRGYVNHKINQNSSHINRVTRKLGVLRDTDKAIEWFVTSRAERADNRILAFGCGIARMTRITECLDDEHSSTFANYFLIPTVGERIVGACSGIGLTSGGSAYQLVTLNYNPPCGVTLHKGKRNGLYVSLGDDTFQGLSPILRAKHKHITRRFPYAGYSSINTAISKLCRDGNLYTTCLYFDDAADMVGQFDRLLYGCGYYRLHKSGLCPNGIDLYQKMSDTLLPIPREAEIEDIDVSEDGKIMAVAYVRHSLRAGRRELALLALNPDNINDISVITTYDILAARVAFSADGLMLAILESHAPFGFSGENYMCMLDIDK